MVVKNYKLHLFDQQGDKGKAPTSEQSTNAPEEVLHEEAIFLSTNLIQTIRRLLIKLNKKLASLIMIQPWTEEIRGQINTMMAQIHQYEVRNSFNCPIYLFMILIILSFIKKTLHFKGVFQGVSSSW